MCGIVGWVGLAAAESSIDAMTASIAHRGPDDRGRWVGDGAALGMTRLAVIDVEGGLQPRFAGPWCCVFNGEIYNYREVRDRLIAAGSTIDGDGDSEVVTRAVAMWGPDAFDVLDGMFAVAAYHRESRQLLLARDRSGEKPLYVWRHREGVAFASEPRAFRALGRMPDLDDDSLVRYLRLGFVPGPASIWKDISTLPPGHVATITGADLRLAPQRPIAEPAPPLVTPPPGNSDGTADIVEELDRRLELAVTSRLVADVEVGVLLSGGIDSSLVALHAARAVPGLHTFSVAIDDPRRNESAFARQVAERVGSTHHVLTVGDADARGVVHELADVYDEPFADASAIPTLLLSRFVAPQVKVALSGDGGDEYFTGYRRHRLAAADDPGRGARPLAGLAALATRTWWIRPQDPWRSMRQRFTDPVETYLDEMGAVDETWIRDLGLEGTAMDPVHDRVRRARCDDPERWPARADRDLYLPGDLLVKIDRASMSCGLEVRAPFLAPVIADWAAALRPEVLGPPGEKAVPRALVRRHFGPEIADRPKQGFSVPLASWLRGGLTELVDLACDGHLVNSGRLDRRAVGRMRSALHRRFDGAAAPLWTIAMFEHWHQTWGR